MNAEQSKKLEIAALAAFKQSVEADGGKNISHGAAIMPRSLWARGITFALIDAGLVDQQNADETVAILGSAIGNSSQIGAVLLKDGFLVQQGASEAATSFAEQLAKRAAAKTQS